MYQKEDTQGCSLYRTQTDHIDADVITDSSTLNQHVHKMDLAHLEGPIIIV